CENARVIAVKSEVIAVGLQGRADQILVGHHIKLEALLLLAGIDVEDLAQHSKGGLLIQQLDLRKVWQVRDKAVGLTQEDGDGAVDLLLDQNNLFPCAEQGLEIGHSRGRTLAQEAPQGFGQSHFAGVGRTLVQQDVIDVDGKHFISLVREVTGALLLGTLDNRVVITASRVGLKMGFKEILVNAEFRAEQSECRFQTFGGVVEGALVQTFVVNALNLDHRADCAGLGEKTAVIDETEYAALLGQGAGFLVMLDEFSQIKHGCGFS